DHFLVDAGGKRAVLIEHVRDTARHARAEIAPGRAEDDHASAGHVLAAVIADCFHDGVYAAVAHAEALASHAADVRLAAGCAIQSHVADDDVLVRHERRAGRRRDDQL